jgi:hypothetical protein
VGAILLFAGVAAATRSRSEVDGLTVV